MKILVVGDIILDKYYNVSISRKADESNVDIWDEEHVVLRLGGAANVAANVKEICKLNFINADVYIAGLCDINSFSLLQSNGIDTRYVLKINDSLTKTRFVNQNKIIGRHDNLKKFYQCDIDNFEHYITNWSLFNDDKFDAVIFSDYNKGTITESIVNSIKDKVKLTVVDSKRDNLLMFSGMTVLKLNEKEFSAQQSSQNYHNVINLFKYVVVTRGKNGAELWSCEKSTHMSNGLITFAYKNNMEHFHVRRVQEVDVTGCGDTHTAALTVELLQSSDIRKAVRFANNMASNVVQTMGTAVPTKE